MVWTEIMNKLRRAILGMGRKKKGVQTAPPDRAVLEEYLEQMVQELNMKLLCQTDTAQSGSTLWVREITVTEYDDGPEERTGRKQQKAERQKERKRLWR